MIAILGQGLAGTILALRLAERGVDFTIFDDGHKSSSSMVAAGLWNPIVFRRINKSWMADDFIPELESFYPRMENLLGADFYRPRPVWRVHGSKQERDKWYEKNGLRGFEPYLFNPPEKFAGTFGHKPEFGEGEVRHCGYLDIPVFLASAKDRFSGKGNYLRTILDGTPTSKGLEAALGKSGIIKIIDCRGYRSSLSAWWEHLPFGLTKGEVLTLKAPSLELDRTFNAGFFVLPLGNRLFRVGSTFSWKDKSEEPTEYGKEELLTKFEKYFGKSYDVIDHKAGIRPTVQDRRPLLGRHPVSDNLYIFNGLGTKGVMLAPYLARHFCDWLLDGEELLAEADIGRFEKFLGEKNPSVNYPNP